MSNTLQTWWQLKKAKDKRLRCTCCQRKPLHQLIDRKQVVRAVNRSHGTMRGIFRKRYVCVHARTQYFLCDYAVYRCTVCGKCKNLPISSKQISKEDAKQSGLPILPNMKFRTMMYH